MCEVSEKNAVKEILYITRDNFKSYGWVLDFSENAQEERFEVIVSEDVNPWRIAMFRVKIRECNRLEAHPDSMESFEPVSGCGLLIVAMPETPKEYQVFLLDRPICLKKGIWHEVITISKEALFKITENKEVSSKFYMLEDVICPAFIEK